MFDGECDDVSERNGQHGGQYAELLFLRVEVADEAAVAADDGEGLLKLHRGGADQRGSQVGIGYQFNRKFDMELCTYDML